MKIYSLLFIVFYFITILFFANYSVIHTDEYWTYAEIFYYSKGLQIYDDFFSHRLPFLTFANSFFYNFLSESFLSSRFVSCMFSLLSLILTISFFEKKNSFIDLFIVLLIFFYPLNLYLSTSVTSYPLINFLALLSLKFLYCKKYYTYSFISTLMYCCRYLIDYIIPSLFLSSFIIFKKNKEAIIFLLIPLISFLLLFFLFGEKLFFDTFYYNLRSLSIQESHHIIPEHYLNLFNKFMMLRKLEFLTWFNIYLVFLFSIYVIIKKKLLNTEFKIIFINIFFIFLFYYLSFNDYPITKIYLIPFILILYIKTSIYINKVYKYLLMIVLIFSILISDLSFLQKKINKFDLCNHIKCTSNVLVLNPILNTLVYPSNTKLIMDLYSFLHDGEHFNNLYDKEEFLNDIYSNKYDYIVLDERFESRKNISKIFTDSEFTELKVFLNQQYKLNSFYIEDNLGMKIFIYER